MSKYKVTVVDINTEKINAWNGPLDQFPSTNLVWQKWWRKCEKEIYFFSTDIDKAIDEAQMIFMAVNTPTKTEGEGAGMAADLCLC